MPSACWSLVTRATRPDQRGRKLDRSFETIEALPDPDAVQTLTDTEPVVFGRDAIRA
jgi:hypothetical protein